MNREMFSKLGEAPEASINWLIQYALDNPQVISLAAGLVDATAFPTEWIRTLQEGILRNPIKSKACLQYGVTQGEKNLRTQIADDLNNRDGMQLLPEDVLVTNGSQQLLYLLSQIIINPGDLVLVESPSYYVFMDALKQFGARLIHVPCDEYGMIPVELEKIFQSIGDDERKKLKMIYTITYCQNPTGRSYTLQRKRELWNLIDSNSKRFPYVLVEDAAYRELNFKSDVLSFLSMGFSSGRFVYTGTFSKAVAPGLRLGYGIVPKLFLQKMINLKGSQDFGSSHLSQFLIAEMLSSPDWHGYLNSKKIHYSKKANYTETLLQKYLPELRYRKPQGGLYYWLEMPMGISTGMESYFFKECLKENILYVPGSLFYDDCDDSGENYLRITYAFQSLQQIEEGIQRMNKVFNKL